MSAHDYLIQLVLVLVAAGAVVGVRYLFVRYEKPKKKPAARKPTKPTKTKNAKA